MTKRRQTIDAIDQPSIEISAVHSAKAYTAALEEYGLAAAEVRRQLDQLKKFTDAATRSPGKVRFVGLDGESHPPLCTVTAANCWNVDEFPTPHSLQLALTQRELAKRKLQLIWNDLPAAARSKLTAPPRR